MERKIFKDFVKEYCQDLKSKIDLICEEEEITEFWNDTTKIIEDDFRLLMKLSDPWVHKGIFNGDLLMFVDGFVKYLYASFCSLTIKDESSVMDMKFSLHSSIVSQTFNGMNHISHLLVKDVDVENKSIQSNVKKFIKNIKNVENEIYCDALEYYVNSYKFLSIQEIRNHLTHSYSFPLEFYGIHLVAANIISIAFRFIYYVKTILDGDDWLEFQDKNVAKNEARNTLNELLLWEKEMADAMKLDLKKTYSIEE